MNEQVLEKIKEAGVVGAGGAGFPTHVKMKCDAEYVLVNCAECEPLIKSDKYLMERHAEELVNGLLAALKATGAKKGVFAVKYKNKLAVESLQIAARGREELSVHLLDNYYPAGDEQQIIYEVTGRTIPVGQLPIRVGCVVVNAQTCYHISRAMKGYPVTRRNVTITGEVAFPLTLEAAIGTPVPYLIEQAGGVCVTDYVVVIGGPLMGRVSSDPEKEFVTKTTNGIVVMPKDHPLIIRKMDDLNHQFKIAKAACCQCNYCTLICPRSNLGLGVQPHKVMQALTFGNADVLVDGGAVLGCCNCGLCTYVGCNMGLSPSRFISRMRSELMAKKVKSTQKQKSVNPFREESKVPSHRVIARMGLTKYDHDISFAENCKDSRAVRLLMKQHIGVPCQPIVHLGDIVTEGQCVGRVPDGALGALVHASVSGQVVDVGADHVDIMKA